MTFEEAQQQIFYFMLLDDLGELYDYPSLAYAIYVQFDEMESLHDLTMLLGFCRSRMSLDAQAAAIYWKEKHKVKAFITYLYAMWHVVGLHNWRRVFSGIQMNPLQD